MAEFRWTEVFLFMILLLQFTAAGQRSSSSTVTVGGEATLSCGNVINDQDECDSTTWLFADSRSRAAVALIEHGKIHKDASSKSDRLSVTENCSLVVKKVTAEDVGRYTCRQFNSLSGKQQGPDALVLLSVVTMTEQKVGDEVTLTCSVSMIGQCRQTSVRWLYQSRDVDKDNHDLEKSESLCSASVKFRESHFIHQSRFKIFSCEVTDDVNKQQVTFPLQPSPEKSGEDKITATTQSTAEISMKAGESTTASTTNGASTKPEDWLWLCLIVVVAFAALLVFVVIWWKRSKGNKTPKEDNVGLSSNPAPETSQDPVRSHSTQTEPEDGVSYASISYTRETPSKAQVRRKTDDHESDAVTYTTVKAPSAEPNSLYTSVR
ncbi:uncharacterized protein [Trachinotus anak]|uniref:uncharacterized protein isoform X2 n=1 Tax=Trachinotus anak TaxID=443729 RepID=UPI0039F222E4